MQMETQDQQVKNLNRWKPKDYVNIWVVRSICSTTYGCNVYGYANYPFAHGSNTDGIVMESAYLAELGKIAGLAHEVGHYLGLYHTFEGGCSNNNCLVNGDRICDTPPDQSTAAVPCGEFFSSCSTDTQSGPFTSDQPDMSWNFMDYGILACFHDYTADQSTRMNATLDGIRKSLLESKGCLPPCPSPTVAAFTASATTVAAGETVLFNNNSQNALSYTWTLDGVPFGNQPNAGYTFTTPGVYTVVLNAQPLNSSLCEANTTQITIEVFCDVTASFTLSELTPDQDETLFLSNTSQNATQIEWFVDGVSQGSVLDSIVFSAVGPYEIMLVTSNGICGDTATESIYVLGVCVQKTFDYKIDMPDYPDGSSLFSVTVSALTDGSLVLLGAGSNINSDHAPLLTKIKPNGEIVWAKKIGLDSTTVNNAVMKATPDGGFIVFASELDWLDAFIDYNYLAKFSADGSLVWCQQVLEGSVNYVSNLLVYPNGDILLCGASSLAKFTSNGTLIWAKDYFGIERVTPYPDGGFVALESPFITRFNGVGNAVWRRLLTSTVAFQLKTLLAMPDGSIFVGGELGTNFSSVVHGGLVKLDGDGETIWSKSYRQIPVSTYLFECMALSPSGNLAIAGLAKADNPGINDFYPYNLLLEMDLEGNIIWSRHRPEEFRANDMISLPSGGYVITQKRALTTPDPTFRILKTDALGRTAGCPESPKIIDAYPLVVTNTLLTFSNPEVKLLEIVPLALPVEDIPWAVDTLCAPQCQQSFEICNNNLDDDGDGLFDCLDAECNCEENLCEPQQGNLWYFGYGAGLDFSENPPKVLGDGQTNSITVSATMCDVEGNLLLYTDGLKVYNRFHQPMPNGNLQQTSFAYQSIIIPHPGQPSQYFVVVNYPVTGLFVSLVDMTLDDGRGDLVVLQKNILLSAIASGIAAVKSCSFQGFWLLSRTLEKNSKFLAFRVDQNGLFVAPFSSSDTGQNVDEVAQIKISPDGQKVACTYFAMDSFYVSTYQFNPYTSGVVSNPSLLGALGYPFAFYGVEFSPNGRFLYVSGEFQGAGKLLQFDLEAGDLAAVKSSQVQLAVLPDKNIRFLQLAPNGKIYAPIEHQLIPPPFDKLDVIHKPDLPGNNCQYQHEGLDISGFPPLVGYAMAFATSSPPFLKKRKNPFLFQMPPIPSVNSMYPFSINSWLYNVR
jgi:PKD repeat protein